MIGTALTWIVVHRNNIIKAILGLSVGLLLTWGITLSKLNKKLSESLERALNNIEAYLGSIEGSLLANNVLRFTIDELRTQNDKLIRKMDSVRHELNIKEKQLSLAATQTHVIHVNIGKEITGDILTILKDTTYSDSIKCNDLTMVKYTIGKDTVNMELDIRNTQYLYLYNDRKYLNKKNFIKRLFTWDFKKVNKYKYYTVNTNDLLKLQDVRIVEVKQ